MMESIKGFFDDQAAKYDRQADDRNDFFTRRNYLVSELIVRTVPKCRSLDVGCGAGLLVELLLSHGYDAHGYDISDKMVEKAAARLSRITGNAERRVMVSTPDAMPFESDFSLLTAIGLFIYIPDHERFVRLLSSRLAANGYVCATSTNRFSIFSYLSAWRSLSRGAVRTTLNLIRTGVWSAGSVDPAIANQRYSARSFDRLFRQNGFSRVASFGLYNVRRLDRSPFSRGRIGRFLVRHLGWTYVAIYQQRCEDRRRESS